MFVIIWLLVAATFTSANFENDEYSSVPRGAQIRITKSGLQYAASVGVQKLHEKLTNKKIDSQSGHNGDLRWGAENIIIHYVKISHYLVTPIPNTGLRLAVGKIDLSLEGSVWAHYHKGWINLKDRTTVYADASGLSFSLDFKIGAKGGKPTLAANGCSANIHNLNLKFKGGLDWLYNLLSKFLEKALEKKLQSLMCEQGIELINKEANKELEDFPVRKNLKRYGYIDYSFQTPYISSQYIDLFLRGEFLNYDHPVPSGISPPVFDTTSASSKMVYVWLTDYTLNSLGRVFHEAHLLNRAIKPEEKLPPGVKKFMNTGTLKDIIPQLYQQYPDRPIHIILDTITPPHFKIHPGGINLDLNVKAGINVVKKDNSIVQVFHLDISVSTSGLASIQKYGKELNIGGLISEFKFKINVGGSIIGHVTLPVENQSIKDMVRGLVIDQANPILDKGFPIPKSSRMDFKYPSITFVENAIRVDTIVSYQ